VSNMLGHRVGKGQKCTAPGNTWKCWGSFEHEHCQIAPSHLPKTTLTLKQDDAIFCVSATVVPSNPYLG